MMRLFLPSRSGTLRSVAALAVLLLGLLAGGPAAQATEAEDEIVVIDQTILIFAYGTDDYDVSVIATIVAEPETTAAFADEVFNDEAMIDDAEDVLQSAGIPDVGYELGDLNLDNDLAERTLTFTPLTGDELAALMTEVGRDVIQTFDLRDEGNGAVTMDVTIEPLTVATEAIGTADGFDFIPSTALNFAFDGVEVTSANIAPEDEGDYLWLGLEEDPVLASVTFADPAVPPAPDQQADDQAANPATQGDTPADANVQPVAPSTPTSTSSGPPVWLLVLLGVVVVALVGAIIALLVRRGGGSAGSGGQQYPQQPWAGQPQGPPDQQGPWQGEQGPWPGQQGQPQGQPWPPQPQGQPLGPWQGQ